MKLCLEEDLPFFYPLLSYPVTIIFYISSHLFFNFIGNDQGGKRIQYQDPDLAIIASQKSLIDFEALHYLFSFMLGRRVGKLFIKLVGTPKFLIDRLVKVGLPNLDCR